MKPSRMVAKSLFAALDRVLGALPGPHILIYHQVGAGHGREMDVAPETFRDHLDWIETRGRRVVSLTEALEARGRQNSQGLLALTFDDGYEDMYLHAYPLLRERSLPFTLYLTTHQIETGTPLAPDRASRPLTWDQVRDMYESGLMTLGAHTHMHPDLRFLGSDEIAIDLQTSDRLIEERTGVPPAHFAYPYGYWSATADRLVRSRYSSAALGGGVRATDPSDSYLVHRVPIQLSDGIAFFRHKIRRGQRTEEMVRRLIAGYRGP